jgi:flagellar motility protein MotE (MotC chaperone)
MIASIIRYDYEKYDEAKKVTVEHSQFVLFGAEDPYILDYDVYKDLKETEKKYNALKEAAQDQSNAITKDVLDQRSEILRRIGEALNNTKADIENSVEKLKNGDAELAKREGLLQKEKKKFFNQTSSKKALGFDQAQKDILKSFASMDPETIVKIITNEKLLVDLKGSDKTKAVAYAASYVNKLKTRKRAGVMEALSSDWAMAINNYLEGQLPL